MVLLIVSAPIPTPVTTPPATVAIAPVTLVHVPLTVSVKVVVEYLQKLKVPEIGVGAVFTVITAVVVQLPIV